MQLQNSGQISPSISNRIDIIRGTAALGVIYGHSIYGFEGLPIELNGAFWVWIFLSISGYLVGAGYLPGGYELTARGYTRFFVNRILRIIPLAYIALGAGIVILLASGKPLPPTVLKQFFFVPPLNDMSLSGPLWTVAAEMQFYFLSIFLVPITVHGMRRGGVFFGFFLLLLAVIVGHHWVAWVGDNISQPRTFIGNIVFFIFGLLLASSTKFKLVVPPVLTGISIAIGVMVAWYLQNYQEGYFWGWGPATGMLPLGGGALLALAISFAVLTALPPSPSHFVPKRVSIAIILSGLAWCGRYTYGIYVWHAIIAVLDANFLHVPPGLMHLGLLLLAVALAPLSYRLLEKPFLHFKLARR